MKNNLALLPYTIRLLTGICIITLLSSLPACNKPSKAKEDPNAGLITYETSDEVILNPERGFMHLYAVASEGEPLKQEVMDNLKKESVTLVHRNYYFEKFKDKPLSQKELDLIQADFDAVRKAGVKMILCFAYTGIEYVYYNNEEDAPLSTIEMHLDQLKPLFEANKDVIAFVQAGFVGPWGEWHSSTHNLTTPDNMKKVLNKMLQTVPSSIMLQVRTPAIKQAIFDTKAPVDSSIAFSTNDRSRVGHYNDCFLTGPTDYGTYNDIVADRAFIANETMYVPAGGETCPPEGDAPSCEKSIQEMKTLKWTYLNLDWYKPTLNGWRQSGCFTEFQRNLGYRLAVSTARIPDEVSGGKPLSIQLTLTNSGYAPVYNKKNCSLVFVDSATGNAHTLTLNLDVRKCKPSDSLTINDDLSMQGVPAGTYAVYLHIADQDENLSQRAEYSIRLANKNMEFTSGGLNNLNHRITVTNN